MMLTDENLAACWQTVETLFARYGWSALEPDELMKLLLNTIQHSGIAEDLTRQAVQCYALALYDGCHQTDDSTLRERSFTDLSHYLYRTSLQRWPAEAEELAQQALVLIYNYIDECEHPAAFLTFALFKLRQARRDHQRRIDREKLLTSSSEPSDLPERSSEQTLIEDALIRQEGLSSLLEALRLLPYRLQQTVILKYFRSWSDNEIGEHLGVTANYVRVLRHRALALLRNDQHLRGYFVAADERQIL